MDVKDLKVQIDTKDASMVLKVMRAAREELITQLSFNVFGSATLTISSQLAKVV